MPPPVLYKYLSADRVSTLATRELRFTPPSDFNDPFEAFPKVEGPKRETVRKNLMPGGDLNDLMGRATPFFEQEGPQMVVAEVSRTFGVLCLAGEPDNPLLWAHYTEGHKGFAIGFDSTHEWFQGWDEPMPPIDRIQQVVYAENRPSVTIGHHDDFTEAETAEIARAMLCTKYISWEYEREWRLIRPLHGAHSTRAATDGSAIHLFQYPADAIVEVVMGLRMTEAKVEELKRALAAGGLEHVRVRRLRRSATSFTYELTDLETA